MRRKKTREEKGEKREENACIQKEGEMNGGIGFFFFLKWLSDWEVTYISSVKTRKITSRGEPTYQEQVYFYEMNFVLFG